VISDSEELLNEQRGFLSHFIFPEKICDYGELENIVTKVGQIRQTVTIPSKKERLVPL
jgi:hypothetical protein